MSAFEMPDESNEDRLKRWLLESVRRRDWNDARLSQQSGVSKATISRIHKEGKAEWKTVAKLAQALGVAPPSHPGAEKGFREEPARFELTRADRDVLGAASSHDNPLEFWVVRGRELDLAGVQPGDRLAFDLNADPARGDIVVAQLYDFDVGAARTVIRLYDPPVLATRSSSANEPPEMIEGGRASIKGVMTLLYRRRSD